MESLGDRTGLLQEQGTPMERAQLRHGLPALAGVPQPREAERLRERPGKRQPSSPCTRAERHQSGHPDFFASVFGLPCTLS